jgi:hypothetical protein
MDEHTRRALAELFAADDKWRAEHEDWLARRNAEREALARKSGEDGLMHRTTENNARDAAPDSLPAVSSDDDGTILGSAERDDQLARALGKIISEMRKEWQSDIAACRTEMVKLYGAFRHEWSKRNPERIAKFQVELDQLRGRLHTLSVVLRDGPKSKAAKNVVDLPNWRKRNDAA